MKSTLLALAMVLVLPFSSFASGLGGEAWGGGGCGYSCASSYSSFSSYQEVIVYPSTFPAYSNASYGYGGGYGGSCGGGCGGYGAFQHYPMVVGQVSWGCDWGCGYDPQWVHDPWTDTWY
jgi:hypothetical protein